MQLNPDEITNKSWDYVMKLIATKYMAETLDVAPNQIEFTSVDSSKLEFKGYNVMDWNNSIKVKLHVVPKIIEINHGVEKP